MEKQASGDRPRRAAMRFVLLMGVVSLFADMTYEGARSIVGPFMALLGASGTAVGFASGFGELCGHLLRLPSGYWSDRTRRYWAITIAGYAVNMAAVPLLALADRWEAAAALMIAERMGKAIRTPARDAMLSHAASRVGRGWAFGVHEALDQVGAMAGPLIAAAVLYAKADYRSSFAILIIPAALTIGVLLAARGLYPRPKDLESVTPGLQPAGLSRAFWLYLAAMALNAAGTADFALIGYHFQIRAAVPPDWIPVFYSIAMGVDAVAALVCGRLFDRAGISILMGSVFIAAWFAPLVFQGGFYAGMAGMALWGVGMGAQESIMRAAVAGMVAAEKRGTAYGIFNTAYGAFWFLGSALMGWLYDFSIAALIGFSVLTQLAALPLLFRVGRGRLVPPRRRPHPG
jgi:MFS family permease